VALNWQRSLDGVNWDELSALYRAAPLGDKKPMHLQKVFTNSLFVSFVYDDGRLVGAGRALADGGATRFFIRRVPCLGPGVALALQLAIAQRSDARRPKPCSPSCGTLSTAD